MAEARRPNGYPVSNEITIRQEAARPNGYPLSNEITSTLNEITVALTQPNFFILGVYESSNAKKDIVVEKITRRVMRGNLFDLIVRASVMKKPDLKRIQGKLGNMLGLQICEKTLEGRARLLYDKIKTTCRILIILDDVWGQINFNRIGIPYENNHNNHNGYKILVISETQNVLSSQTNAQIQFIVSLYFFFGEWRAPTEVSPRTMQCPNADNERLICTGLKSPTLANVICSGWESNRGANPVKPQQDSEDK